MKHDFKCKKCNYKFFVDAPIGGISSDDIECPKCRGKVSRIWFPIPIHYKSDGFTKRIKEKN